MRYCGSGRDRGAESSRFTFFAGTDLWRDGAFLNGGLLWSPAGLDTGGFTLKLLLNGGEYVYPSGGLHVDVDGTMLSAAALPGWRWTRDSLTIDVFAGPVVQNYRLTPYDPGSRLRGFYAGAQFATDVWYQPNPATMIALDGSIASIALVGAARAAIGRRSSESFFVGDEGRDIAPQIQERGQLDRRFGRAKRRPGKDRETQIDRSGIERVDGVLEIEPERLVGVKPPGCADQALRKVAVDAPIPRRVGIGQRVARNGAAKSQVIELGALHTQTRFDVAQALSR